MRQLSGKPRALLRRSFSHVSDAGQKRAFFLQFKGEGVLDHGGPYRAVFQIAADEAARALRLLEPVPNGRLKAGSNRDALLFASSATPDGRVAAAAAGAAAAQTRARGPGLGRVGPGSTFE